MVLNNLFTCHCLHNKTKTCFSLTCPSQIGLCFHALVHIEHMTDALLIMQISVPTSDFYLIDLEWCSENQLAAHVTLTPGVWIWYFMKHCACLSNQWNNQCSLNVMTWCAIIMKGEWMKISQMQHWPPRRCLTIQMSSLKTLIQLNEKQNEMILNKQNTFNILKIWANTVTKQIPKREKTLMFS